MRCLPAIAITLLATAVLAHAQTQEKKLLDRVMKPDMQAGNPLQGKSFGESSSVAIKSSSESSASFIGAKEAYTKGFQESRSFLGIKNPWFGEKVYRVESDGKWTKDFAQAANKEVPVRKAEAVGFYDATKPANFGSPVTPVSTFIPSPAAPGAVSQITDKVKEKMTIDEVREILNKPR